MDTPLHSTTMVRGGITVSTLKMIEEELIEVDHDGRLRVWWRILDKQGPKFGDVEERIDLLCETVNHYGRDDHPDDTFGLCECGACHGEYGWNPKNALDMEDIIKQGDTLRDKMEDLMARGDALRDRMQDR